jgi:hypothetical protein
VLRQLIRVDARHHVALGVLGGLVVPVPERQCKSVVVEQLRQDPLVEVEVEAVPGEEEPALVNLERVRVRWGVEVEMVVAVEAVELPLVDIGAAVGVRQRHHELHGALVLGDVGVVDELCSWAGPHRQVGLELEFRGPLGGGNWRAAFFGGETVVQVRSREW